MRTFAVKTSYKTKHNDKFGLIKTETDGGAYKHGQWACRLIKKNNSFYLEVISDEAPIKIKDTVEFYQPPRLLAELLIEKEII